MSFNPQEIEDKLDRCLAEVTGDARDYIISLNDYFERNGFLSTKQQEALDKFHENLD